jgi:ComF family protein
MSWITEAKAFSKACFKPIEDLLFPAQCCVCYELQKEPICDSCSAEIVSLANGSCLKCGIDEAGENKVCHWLSAVDAIRGACAYKGAGGIVVKQLKFGRAIELASPMAQLMREPASQLAYDYLVPVPIHWSRHSQRGFNQSEVIANHLKIGGVRVGLLERIKATWPQSRSSGSNRRLALQGAFRAKPCPGARILLVDDVITSGGTVEACAQELKAAGASWVGALAFAIEL